MSESTFYGARETHLVGDIYRAGAGLLPWSAPLGVFADRLGLWIAAIIALDKKTGDVLFAHEGTRRPPEISRKWIREYHRIDPRAALVAGGPTGRWFACNEHFDEAFVGSDPFFQEFLIPHGGRYSYASKLADDGTRRILIAFSRPRGSQQLDQGEREIARSWAGHVVEALRMQEEIGANRAIRAPEPAMLAEAFGLTTAEARVAAELAAGRSPKEIARRLGLMPSTIRSHLKRILAKTGTHRQSEAVGVLLTRAAR